MRAGVPRLAVSQQSDIAGGKVVAIQLEEFTSANIFDEEKRIAIARLIFSSRNPVGEECELSARAAGKLYQVYLSRVAKRVSISISRFVGCQLAKLAVRNSL